MESQRSFLVIGLVLVSFLLYQQWLVDYSPAPQVPAQTEQTVNNTVGSALPVSNEMNDDLPSSSNSPIVEAPKQEQHLVTVTTDTFEVKIDTKGGDVVQTVLLKHDAEHQSDDKFVLLSQQPTVYVAQSGLIGRNGPDASGEGRPLYNIAKTEWVMDNNTLVVPMTYISKEGLEVTKTFYFEPNKHSIEVSFNVKNTTSLPLEIQPFYQLKQDFSGDDGSMMMPTYRGGAYSTADESYEHYDFDDMTDKSLNTNTLGGWVGMIQHYFVSAWVPAKDQQNNIYSRVLGNSQSAIIGVKSPVIVVNSGEIIEARATLFSGPKNQEELGNIHETLDLTVDYGILWFISQILFSLLITIYGVVGNWGIAIILITVFVKMLMFPLTKKQYESMAKMRALQPKMEQLKQRFGDDRQKFGQATMELYKKEKVNPMGGCLPLLLQMPIFLALYWVFLESVELRHAPFGLWISDLSAADPYYILPALFGASMFLMQKLSPSPTTDPMQRKMMLWMPVVFSVFFIMFPAGLVLYWFVSNVISIIQMLVIYRNIDKKNAAKK
jgi:YidC/Oxa1 family membrane protein insertase